MGREENWLFFEGIAYEGEINYYFDSSYSKAEVEINVETTGSKRGMVCVSFGNERKEAFVENGQSKVRFIILDAPSLLLYVNGIQLGSHRCYVWCGGNELQDYQGDSLDDQDVFLAMLKEKVQRLDPTRKWLPTSPRGDIKMKKIL